jgi:hypothetical protein
VVNNCLLPLRGLFQFLDVELHHLEHRLHHAMRLRSVLAAHELAQDSRHDLQIKLDAALRDLVAAKLENERLAAENEQLRAVALHAGLLNKDTAGESITGHFHDGIEYVNQIEACLILGMNPEKEQYRISRWVKANKFQMIAVPGLKKKQIVRASLHKPERGQPGRKKK